MSKTTFRKSLQLAGIPQHAKCRENGRNTTFARNSTKTAGKSTQGAQKINQRAPPTHEKNDAQPRDDLPRREDLQEHRQPTRYPPRAATTQEERRQPGNMRIRRAEGQSDTDPRPEEDKNKTAQKNSREAADATAKNTKSRSARATHSSTTNTKRDVSGPPSKATKKHVTSMSPIRKIWDCGTSALRHPSFRRRLGNFASFTASHQSQGPE